MKHSLSRRSFFRTSLGALGTIAATRSLAQICGEKTGAQPLGPFFPNAGTPEIPVKEDPNPSTPIFLANDNDLTYVKGTSGKASGQVVFVTGQVTDENCVPLPNATLIIWQASHSGRYNHKGDAENHDFLHPKTGKVVKRTVDPSFQYWGKATTDKDGVYHFKTIVPGFYPADLQGGWYRPPHIHFMVSATGFPQFVTQLYFKGELIQDNEWIQELNKKDLLLQTPNLSDEQREKLIVEFSQLQSGPFSGGLVGTFDITMSR